MATKKRSFFKPGSNLSYEEIMAMYKDIARNVYEKNADLVLPQNFKYAFFGNKVAFCQVINTWFAKNNKSIVRIYDNHFPADEKDYVQIIEKLVMTAELPTLLILCFGIFTKILGYGNTKKDYTSLFLDPVRKRLIFDYRELSRNYSNKESFSNEYFQIHPDFFDNLFFSNNLSFYKQFGITNPQYYLQKESEINPVSQKLFNRLQSFDNRVSLAWLKRLQTFFYEIFDNAFNWARIDWRISKYQLIEKSNRLFFISSKNYINIERAINQATLNLDKSLFNFAQKNTTLTNWGHDVKLLELSFLDNGNGIVETFRINKKIDKLPSDSSGEYSLLLEAFAFGSTSDMSSKAEGRGMGLYKVISSCKSVFVILRTGHLHLYRDFETHPFDESQPFYFFDVSDSTSEVDNHVAKIQKYPYAQGTLFTFIIPLLKNVL